MPFRDSWDGGLSSPQFDVKSRGDNHPYFDTGCLDENTITSTATNLENNTIAQPVGAVRDFDTMLESQQIHDGLPESERIDRSASRDVQTLLACFEGSRQI